MRANRSAFGGVILNPPDGTHTASGAPGSFRQNPCCAHPGTGTHPSPRSLHSGVAPWCITHSGVVPPEHEMFPLPSQVGRITLAPLELEEDDDELLEDELLELEEDELLLDEELPPLDELLEDELPEETS